MAGPLPFSVRLAGSAAEGAGGRLRLLLRALTQARGLAKVVLYRQVQGARSEGALGELDELVVAGAHPEPLRLEGIGDAQGHVHLLPVQLLPHREVREREG